MFNDVRRFTKFLLNPIKTFRNDNAFKLRTVYAREFEKNSIDNEMILYESYHGKNATCNPFAMFLEISKNEKFTNYTHVWCLNEKDSESAKILKKFKNVIIIERETVEYVKYLTKAKYLINNTSFPYYFHKKEGQVYINTWHGTPFKFIGSDVKNSKISGHGNIQRNFLHTDFLISPNRFTHQKLLESNSVNSIFNGKIVDAGYPRVDLTYQTNPLNIKEQLQLNKEKKVILYAPTWREENIVSAEKTIEYVHNYFEELRGEFSSEYEILLKVHYFIYKRFKEKGLEKHCVPDWIDTNELLASTDVLITDYSSIFFDFLHTKKPVLFFTYDKELYESERGLYLKFDDLPGPLCENIDELKESIRTIDSLKDDYKEKYEKMVELYCYNDDGNATKRVIDIIFNQNETQYLCENENVKNKKTKILIWGGGFSTNGITVSLLNLLNNIDYSRYDITLVFASKLNNNTIANLRKVNPNVNIIFRVGTLNYNLREFYSHRLISNFGLGRPIMKKIAPRKLYERELHRIIGDSKFDIAIDYCGYTPLWTLMFSYNHFDRKNIYLHSDMVADSKKVVNGKLRHKNNFGMIFNLYNQFDNLICVSKDATETNKIKLASYEISNKIINVDNAIDYERVLNHLNDLDTIKLMDKEYLLLNHSTSLGKISLNGIEVPKKADINFVTVGRLSPEKDHVKLIHAFNKVSQLFDRVKLYIVGDGVLKQEITNLIKKLNLEEKVFLTGDMENPFALVNKCDCFVLSSNYEGQGLVLLEALILNKHAISTNIPGPNGILGNGFGKLVENSEEGLVLGMIDFILNPSDYKKFDYEQYNLKAMNAFYKDVCGEEKNENKTVNI